MLPYTACPYAQVADKTHARARQTNAPRLVEPAINFRKEAIERSVLVELHCESSLSSQPSQVLQKQLGIFPSDPEHCLSPEPNVPRTHQTQTPTKFCVCSSTASSHQPLNV